MFSRWLWPHTRHLKVQQNRVFQRRSKGSRKLFADQVTRHVGKLTGREDSMRKQPNPKRVRVEELRAILTAYRLMTIEEVEAGEWGDLEVELEGEVWRLEQELVDERRVHQAA
jgi:hypothetical protein